MANDRSTITRYVAGKHVPGTIKLSSNESAFPPPWSIRRAIRRHIPHAHLYPPVQCDKLRTLIAHQYNNISQENVILGNGSDEILSLVGQRILRTLDNVVIPKNTFSVYTIVSELSKARITYVPLTDGMIDLDQMKTQLKTHTKAVFVCNPNNPTGTALSCNSLYRFASSLPSETLFVLDEAYASFAHPRYTIEPRHLFSAHHYSLILHTFSKAFALGGLRIGYGLAPRSIITLLRAAQMPFAINCLAGVAALCALRHPKTFRHRIDMLQKEREKMESFYDHHSIVYFPSAANFHCVDARSVLPELPPRIHADELCTLFARNGITVRSLHSFGMPHHVRITIGTKKANNKVRHVFLSLLKSHSKNTRSS